MSATPAREKLTRFRAAYSALLVAAEELRAELETTAGTPPEVPADIAVICDVVGRHYGVTMAQLVSPRRQEYIAHARMMALTLCAELLRRGTVAIAEALQRHHGMVTHARRTIADWRSLRAANEAVYQKLRAACEAALIP